jgi:arylsulfatase A-like enzyme
MYLGIYRPHSPYTAPKRFYEMYNEKDMTVPPGHLKNDLSDVPGMGKELSKGMKSLQIEGITKEEALLKYLRAYCAGYSFADWNIGRIMDALDRSPYGKNTIVVFCSDNGFHNGTKDHWTKSTLWESADAIPFLIRLPDGKAYTCPQTVSTIDIFPTLIEYCKLGSPRQKLDGQSIVPILKDHKYEWVRPGLTTAGEGYSSVRSERYRYIKYPDGTEELYDHLSDPYEYVNLAHKANMKTVIAELSKSIPVDFAKSMADRPAAKKGKGAGKGDDGE